jgi:phage shock protein PspC (stress-responsive transcriptional regulator)
MIGAMTSQDTQRTDAPGRLLRRRTGDRVIAGVAGGLGDYFNIDPLLIRIGFVGLILFGGAGVVLYLIAWLMVPAEGQNASIVEGLVRRIGLTPGRIVTLVVIAVAFVFLINAWNYPYHVVGDGSVLWAAVVIVLGFLLIRRRDTSPGRAALASAPAVMAPPQAPAVRGPRSPLALYTYGAVLVSIGLLATFSQVAHREVSPGQFFGVAMAILGTGLVVGAWWGRARILILVAILLTPVAVAASFITAPLEGGIGDHRYTPVTMAEVRDEYRLLSGQLILDLTDLVTNPRDIHISASVAVGQLVVIVPGRSSIELRTRVGAGDSIVLGSGDVGTSLDNDYVRRRLHQPTYILDLEAGIGEVFVTDSRVNW